MKLGYVSHGLPDWLQYVNKYGFDGIELYVGCNESPFGVPEHDMDIVKRYAEDFKKQGINILTVQYADNLYERFGGEIAPYVRVISQTADVAKLLGTDIIALNAYAPFPASDADRRAFISKLYKELGEMCEDKGVRIAVENCPHEGRNFVYNLDAMEYFLGKVNDSIGLELDPSHMYWLGCDYIEAARRFGSRVFCVHAKDTEILHRRMGEVGILYNDEWWRYRLPGWGKVDFKSMFTELCVHGFDGPVNIEHEDPVCMDALFGEGLKKGKQYLEQILFN